MKKFSSSFADLRSKATKNDKALASSSRRLDDINSEIELLINHTITAEAWGPTSDQLFTLVQYSNESFNYRLLILTKIFEKLVEYYERSKKPQVGLSLTKNLAAFNISTGKNTTTIGSPQLSGSGSSASSRDNDYRIMLKSLVTLQFLLLNAKDEKIVDSMKSYNTHYNDILYKVNANYTKNIPNLDFKVSQVIKKKSSDLLELLDNPELINFEMMSKKQSDKLLQDALVTNDDDDNPESLLLHTAKRFPSISRSKSKSFSKHNNKRDDDTDISSLLSDDLINPNHAHPSTISTHQDEMPSMTTSKLHDLRHSRGGLRIGNNNGHSTASPSLLKSPSDSRIYKNGGFYNNYGTVSDADDDDNNADAFGDRKPISDDFYTNTPITKTSKFASIKNGLRITSNAGHGNGIGLHNENNNNNNNSNSINTNTQHNNGSTSHFGGGFKKTASSLRSKTSSFTASSTSLLSKASSKNPSKNGALLLGSDDENENENSDSVNGYNGSGTGTPTTTVSPARPKIKTRPSRGKSFSSFTNSLNSKLHKNNSKNNLEKELLSGKKYYTGVKPDNYESDYSDFDNDDYKRNYNDENQLAEPLKSKVSPSPPPPPTTGTASIAKSNTITRKFRSNSQPLLLTISSSRKSDRHLLSNENEVDNDLQTQTIPINFTMPHSHHQQQQQISASNNSSTNSLVAPFFPSHPGTATSSANYYNSKQRGQFNGVGIGAGNSHRPTATSDQILSHSTMTIGNSNGNSGSNSGNNSGNNSINGSNNSISNFGFVDSSIASINANTNTNNNNNANHNPFLSPLLENSAQNSPIVNSNSNSNITTNNYSNNNYSSSIMEPNFSGASSSATASAFWQPTETGINNNNLSGNGSVNASPALSGMTNPFSSPDFNNSYNQNGGSGAKNGGNYSNFF